MRSQSPISAGGSSVVCDFSTPSTSPCRIAGTTGSAMKEAYNLSTKNETDADQQELEALLEAARRATWDALHGPRHLRSDRFRPEAAGEDDGSRKAAEQGIAPDDASRRR